MNSLSSRVFQPTTHLFAAFALALLPGLVPTVNAAQRFVTKWEVFEEAFKSSRSYDNPPQEIYMTVDFISPTGQTNSVHGYWDGGKSWGVRFRPDQLGEWSYTTRCSDRRDNGLHGQKGRFLCTIQSTRTSLQAHGPLTVPRGSLAFEHADGSPFFWLSDGVWDGARNAKASDWAEYAEARSAQGFNVALWTASPGTDDRNRTAYDGTSWIELNTGFLKGLDEKVQLLNRSDLVSAIVPLWEIGVAEEDLLPEDQVIVLLRQMVARWDAYQVAWVIAFEADTDGRRSARWRRIGRSVFDGMRHSPVILFCGSTQWALKNFAEESWVDANAFQSGYEVSESATLWLARGPATTLWRQQPYRPLLNLLPAREAGYTPEGGTISSSYAIEALARSLFVAPPAGLCYQCRPVAQWQQAIDTNSPAATGLKLAEWQVGLHLTGARRVAQLKALLESINFWNLLPSTSVLLPAADNTTSEAPLSALTTPSRERALIYVPEGTTARISPKGLRSGLEARFFSLKSGETQPARSSTNNGIISYTAPGTGDWLLTLAPPQQ